MPCFLLALKCRQYFSYTDHKSFSTETGVTEMLYVLLRMDNDWLGNHIELVLLLHCMTLLTSSSVGSGTGIGKGGLGSPWVLPGCVHPDFCVKYFFQPASKATVPSPVRLT